MDAITPEDMVPPEWQQYIEKNAGYFKTGSQTHAGSREPNDELTRFGEDLDLLIVGSRSSGAVGRLFNGSVSNDLSRYARCPLLVLPRTAARTADQPAESDGGVDTSSVAGGQ